MRCSLAAGLLLAMAALSGAQEPAFWRYVQFRDGSILRLQVIDESRRIILIGPDAVLREITVPLSRVQQLTFTREKDFSRKRALLETAGRLGSEVFQEREKAQADITAWEGDIRRELETCLEVATNIEMRLRLQDLLKRLPESKANDPFPFDRLRIKNSHLGHVGETGFMVLVKGAGYLLDRKEVLAWTEAPPLGLEAPPNWGTASGFRPVSLDDFPQGCIEEPFEKTPDGRTLRPGDNIEKVFISKGFVLSTSVPGSFVSVNTFTVLGKSRGLSAATHKPLWEGEITIRFVQPGRPEVPAGVTYFGCYLAAVLPGGTALVGYDLYGRELGRAETASTGHVFLGVTSAVPIHRIRIVPNPKIDRDYTLDDFLFTPLQTPELRHPEKFTVYLVSGERFHCRDVLLDKDQARFEGMPGALPDKTVPRRQVLRINPPDQGRPMPRLPAGLFAELRDGSVLFAPLGQDQPRPPVFGRKPNLFKDRTSLVGLWNSERVRRAQVPPQGKAFYLDPDQKTWKVITAAYFDKDITLEDPAGQMQFLAYDQLTNLWLARPAPGPVAGWHVQTSSGDDLAVGGPNQIQGRLSGQVQIRWQGRSLSLMAGEIRSIYRVAPAKK